MPRRSNEMNGSEFGHGWIQCQEYLLRESQKEFQLNISTYFAALED